MAQMWLSQPIRTHVSPDMILAENMYRLMYSRTNVHPRFWYPRSPYGFPICGSLSGLGDDCSSLNPPDAPNYQNCQPEDENCVASNAQLDSQYNADLQSYHDAQAACSAEKYAASGGTLTPSALTYGAAQDLLNPTAAPYVQPVGTVAQFTQLIQPYQTSAQTAAESAAMPNTPTMATPQQVGALQSQPNLTPSAAPTQAPATQPGVVPMGTGVSPAAPAVAPSAAALALDAGAPINATVPDSLGFGFYLPLALVGIALLFVFGKGGK